MQTEDSELWYPISDQGPISRRYRKVAAPEKLWQNLKPYDSRAVLFTYTEVPSIQDVTLLCLLKMALRARKVSGALEKQSPGLYERTSI